MAGVTPLEVAALLSVLRSIGGQLTFRTNIGGQNIAIYLTQVSGSRSSAALT